MIRLRFLTASICRSPATLAGATIHATTVVALSNRALTENASVIATVVAWIFVQRGRAGSS